MFNDSKVRTLNRYLESSEPLVPITQAYISNTIGRPILENRSESMTSILTSQISYDDEENGGNDNIVDPARQSINGQNVAFGHSKK